MRVNSKDAPEGYRAVAANGCTGCTFFATGKSCPTNDRGVGRCLSRVRRDKTAVIFVRKPRKKAKPKVAPKPAPETDVAFGSPFKRGKHTMMLVPRHADGLCCKHCAFYGARDCAQAPACHGGYFTSARVLKNPTTKKAPTTMKYNLETLKNESEAPFHKLPEAAQEMFRSAAEVGAKLQTLMADGSWKTRAVDLVGASEIVRIIDWKLTPTRVRLVTEEPRTPFDIQAVQDGDVVKIRVADIGNPGTRPWAMLQFSAEGGKLVVSTYHGIYDPGILTDSYGHTVVQRD